MKLQQVMKSNHYWVLRDGTPLSSSVSTSTRAREEGKKEKKKLNLWRSLLRLEPYNDGKEEEIRNKKINGMKGESGTFLRVIIQSTAGTSHL